MQQVYCRAPTWKYNLGNTLKWLNNITQRSSTLSSIHSFNDENLSEVAEEWLAILGKSTCIKEEAELNTLKEN